MKYFTMSESEHSVFDIKNFHIMLEKLLGRKK